MIRRLALPLVAACMAVALTPFAAAPAMAANASALSVSASCSGSINTSAGLTGVTVTGSATCAGLTTLSLTTTMDTGGAVSAVTSLLPALPNLPVPISTSIPAVGVTSACSVLANAGTRATIASSCSAG